MIPDSSLDLQTKYEVFISKQGYNRLLHNFQIWLLKKIVIIIDRKKNFRKVT